MLITDNRHEVPNISRMIGEGLQMWRAVTLELNIPYFLVRFATREERIWVGQTSLLWRLDDLLDFCSVAAASPDQRILEVGHLSPPNKNRKGEWKMEKISEIWKGVHATTQSQEIVFLGVSGDRIESVRPSTKGGSVRMVERIFPCSRASV
jgi:hypothetical protein